MDDASRPVVVPRETVNDDFVIFLRWLVPDRAFVRKGDAIAEIETSKAAAELEAEHEGYLVQDASAMEQVAVGASLGLITTSDKPAPAQSSVLETSTEVRPLGGAGPTFSKRARELVNEHKLDPSLFAGKALVREPDVRALIDAKPIARPTRRGRAKIADVVPPSPAKRTEIRYLTEGRAALMSAITVMVGTRALDQRIRAAQATRRMSYLDFVIAEAARKLVEFRELNAFYSDEGIGIYAEVNVGTACNLGKGLMVPVMRDADRLSPEEISRIGSEFAMKYLRGEFTEVDLTGGTFTVTDLSGAGACGVLPLINRDQSAILAIGHDSERESLALTLAFDHRVSDGLQATQFLQAVKLGLEGEVPLVAKKLRCGNCFITLERLAATRVTSFLMQVVKADGTASHLCPVCLAGWNG